jgi:hypothetical protein
MKRLLSILFLLIFVYNLAGYFVVFRLEQYAVKRSMKALIKSGLNEEALEKVVVPNGDISTERFGFRLLDEGKEFMYKGKLYDIVKSSTDGKNTVFYCINDKNEERLFANLYEHIKQNNEPNTPAKNHSNNLVKSIIKEALPDNSMEMLLTKTADIQFSIYDIAPLQQYIPLHTPPPKA